MSYYVLTPNGINAHVDVLARSAESTLVAMTIVWLAMGGGRGPRDSILTPGEGMVYSTREYSMKAISQMLNILARLKLEIGDEEYEQRWRLWTESNCLNMGVF